MGRTYGNNGRSKNICIELRRPENGEERGIRKEGSGKRDQERVEGEWRTTAKDRRRWSILMKNGVRV